MVCFHNHSKQLNLEIRVKAVSHQEHYTCAPIKYCWFLTSIPHIGQITFEDGLIVNINSRFWVDLGLLTELEVWTVWKFEFEYKSTMAYIKHYFSHLKNSKV